MSLNNKLLKLSFLSLLSFFSISSFAEISEQRKQELSHLLKHDCGSCHGMTLKGGLGPSLLPETLKLKPDELLFITILEGRPGTPMPPWKAQLSEADANWIIKLLRQGPQ
ncbi:MAG: cytochrome c [Gammaproteobacteria bacterium]|nr:cytochrome c [Gammaproteobacteria bacterium]